MLELVSLLIKDQEQVKHLKKDIESLNQQKKELGERVKELEKAEEESKKIKDKEIADLKQTIKELTEVKMEREKSEERLKKQSKDFADMMKIHKEVYEILGQYSSKMGLLLRSQDIIQKIKELEEKNIE